MTIQLTKPPITSPFHFSERELPWVDEFPFGWRDVTETLADGTVTRHQIPLTQADFLNPQEGDRMPQDSRHSQLMIALYDMLEKHLDSQPGLVVLADIKMRWGIANLKEPAPDIAVIPSVLDKTAIRGSFDVTKHGTRPCLVIEIMSPNYPGDDTDKVAIYEQAGIEEYIIINPHFEKDSRPLELSGYRLVAGKYQPIIADAKGRLLSQTIGVKFGVSRRNPRQLILIDVHTNQPLLTNKAEKVARLKEQAARLKAEQLAEFEAQRAAAAEAELAKLRAMIEEMKSK